MAVRPFTLSEWMRLVLLADEVKQEDALAGEALLRLAQGDESAYAELHDRLNVMGRHDMADRVLYLVRRG